MEGPKDSDTVFYIRRKQTEQKVSLFPMRASQLQYVGRSK